MSSRLTESILQKVSELESTAGVLFDETDFPGYTYAEIHQHLRMLWRVGRIRGKASAGSDDVIVLGEG